MHRLFVAVIISSICFAGCRSNLRSLERNNIAVQRETRAVSDTSFSIVYLGCGGVYLRHTQGAILIDPFFSHQSFTRMTGGLLFGSRIRVDEASIALGKSHIKNAFAITDHQLSQEVQAILSAHGHYDHLLDVPFVHRNWFDSRPPVYLNRSSYNLTSSVMRRDKLIVLDSLTTGGRIVIPLDAVTRFIIYPTRSIHNPHIGDIKFFSGELSEEATYFSSPTMPTRARDWREGETYSFLIDLVIDDVIQFRAYIHSSSSPYPAGIPEEEILMKKKVDLAVLGVASYRFTKETYPCAYLQHLNPGHIMFVHWEDFFRPYHRTEPKVLMRTNMRQFFKRVEECSAAAYTLPVPGVAKHFNSAEE